MSGPDNIAPSVSRETAILIAGSLAALAGWGLGWLICRLIDWM